MPSLKAEIKAMQTTYLSAESKMKGGVIQRQRGSELHRNMVRAVFKNSCAYLRQLVAAGLLPQHFSIGERGNAYYFIAYIGEARPSYGTRPKQAKATKHALTESEREQKVALKNLKKSYLWCRNEFDEALRKANTEAISYRLLVQYSRDLDADYLELRQELGTIPHNLQQAVSKGLTFVVTHTGDNSDSMRCIQVKSQEELEHCLELNKRFIEQHTFNSPEDQLLRAQFEEEFK